MYNRKKNKKIYHLQRKTAPNNDNAWKSKLIRRSAISLSILIVTLLILIAAEPAWIRSIPYLGRAYAYTETIIKGAKLPTANGLYGIDVSKHQGKIDWDKVEIRYNIVNRRINKNGDIVAPLTFAIAKATEGVTSTDPMFEINKNGILKHNLKFGAYHYFSYLSDAKKQAEKYLKIASLTKGNIAPIIDIEEDANLNKLLKRKTITPNSIRQSVLTWLKLVEQRVGVKPIIYTSPNFKTEYLNTPEFDNYPLWIAHYQVSEPRLKGIMWQFTEHGAMNGIDGNVDINIFYGSESDLNQFLIK